jgi:hypothetical protein
MWHDRSSTNDHNWTGHHSWFYNHGNNTSSHNYNGRARRHLLLHITL